MPRKELEALALRWVPGDGPVQVQPMARGLVNESWRIERDGPMFRHAGGRRLPLLIWVRIASGSAGCWPAPQAPVLRR